MALRNFLFAFLILLPTACRAEATQSSFCALVAIPGWDKSGLIKQMDSYAAFHGLKRGAPDATGILYAGQSKSFLIDVLAIRSGQAEVAFFPKVAGTAGDESKTLEQFVLGSLATHYTVTRCEAVPGYQKGVVYGYDKIAI
jgi:hypothetical protein